MFNHIELYAGDPILSLMEAYQRDIRPNKINLSIGLYYNEEGLTPVMDAIALAKKNISTCGDSPSLYLPMSGMPAYCMEVQNLLFADTQEAIQEERIATIQTLGGSGALKIGADFLKNSYPESIVYVSDPTWDNHISIFSGAGLKVARYPYFDQSTGKVDFDSMINCLARLEINSIVILHPCCHNPTGADLAPLQWDRVIEIIKRRQLIPFLDMAYQGFGEGLKEDTYAITAMTKAGLSFLLSNSFSKIFSLYGERIGGLSIVCTDRSEADLVLGQLKATVRKNYSSPPATGAKLVEAVLSSPTLKANWLDELDHMRKRINDMREELYRQLIELGGDPKRFRFLIEQKGMFSYTGFSTDQVKLLKEEFALYLVDSGRICIAGLNIENIGRVARAFLAVTEQLVQIETC
ncbi:MULTISPECIES: aromatic amino acid transaminase [Sphingobacterium]|uniref:amino acid aminotransferase n=1 Tax=Sphingobacterium TaxID=28453 RepID=UPI00257F4510|nr:MULTISPECIES: amino acid aminotransferase [Sphingobacterium]